MRSLLIAIAILFLSLIRGEANGQTLSEVFESSDAVAVVSIVAGQVVKAFDRGCTTVYTGEVIDSWKGPGHGEIVTFRVDLPLLVGWRYLVFVVYEQNPQPRQDGEINANSGNDVSCEESAVSASPTQFGPDNEFSAIFEERIGHDPSVNRVKRYFSGAPGAISLFHTGIDQDRTRVNRPYISELEGIVEAKLLEDQIGAIAGRE